MTNTIITNIYSKIVSIVKGSSFFKKIGKFNENFK